MPGWKSRSVKIRALANASGAMNVQQKDAEKQVLPRKDEIWHCGGDGYNYVMLRDAYVEDADNDGGGLPQPYAKSYDRLVTHIDRVQPYDGDWNGPMEYRLPLSTFLRSWQHVGPQIGYCGNCDEPFTENGDYLCETCRAEL